jgi:predicted RNA-binding Zn-ribbon protein involved in translation (DUF1610 family)
MNAEPICIVCNVKRTLTSVVPVKNRHEMRSHQCPKCGNLFRLVVRRERRPLADEASGRPFAIGTGQRSLQ